ncbi:prephenate dehydrogenase [Treponema sp.]|uniref:prephenate dehydrogenase n=1 Tax=Treponema sp. TaxID=166 RepID=UPI003F0163F2
MKNLSDLVYGIVGFGLMGGSLAKAIRENVLSSSCAHGSIFASDINSASLTLAKEQGIADEIFPVSGVDEMLSQCDFVFICLYPHATLEFLIQHKNSFKSGAVVTDISGVKTEICSHLDEFVSGNFDFIPGHPMAGSEKEGYVNSSGSIFKNHNYILMPLAASKPENVNLFKQLVSMMGFTRIVETDAAVHDHKIAFTSQLCHVIAGALVSSAEDSQITAFGGGSFEDLTRIAMINAPLWTELFLANKKELLLQIENFEKSLDEIKNFIITEDSDSLKRCLENVREKRISMGKI